MKLGNCRRGRRGVHSCGLPRPGSGNFLPGDECRRGPFGLSAATYSSLIVPPREMVILGLSDSPCDPGGEWAPSSWSTLLRARSSDQVQPGCPRRDPALTSSWSSAISKFVITNTGAIPHDFTLGGEETQQAHEEEMAQGDMEHSDPNAVVQEPGETKILTWRFTDTGRFWSAATSPNTAPAA